MSRSRNYLSFDDMCWPNPDDPEELLCNVRHGPTETQIAYLLSCFSAYSQLVYDTQRIRNSKIARIRQHAAAVRPPADTTEGSGS